MGSLLVERKLLTRYRFAAVAVVAVIAAVAAVVVVAVIAVVAAVVVVAVIAVVAVVAAIAVIAAVAVVAVVGMVIGMVVRALGAFRFCGDGEVVIMSNNIIIAEFYIDFCTVSQCLYCIINVFCLSSKIQCFYFADSHILR